MMEEKVESLENETGYGLWIAILSEGDWIISIQCLAEKDLCLSMIIIWI